MLDFRRAPDCQPGFAGLRQEPARLEWHPGLARQLQAAPNDDRRLRERALDVAVLHRDRVEHVRPGLGVDERRAGCRRGDHFGGGIEDLEIQRYELGRVLGGPGVLGDHKRNGLSDIAHDGAREDRLQHALGLGGGREGEANRDPHIG